MGCSKAGLANDWHVLCLYLGQTFCWSIDMYALRLRTISLISVLHLWATPAASTERDDIAPSSVDVPGPTGTLAAPKLTKAKPRIQQPSSVTTPAAVPVPAPKAPIQRVDRSLRPAEHLVRKGDWLSKIAVRYGMSVQEVMDLNGLADDSIDIGDTLSLRPAVAKAPVATAVATNAVTSDVSPKADIPQDHSEVSNATPDSNEAQKDKGLVDAVNSDEAAEGLTAAQLVGSHTGSGDEGPHGVKEADVTIPTPGTGSVNPLSRARLALAIALVVLGMLTIHPRSRAMLLDRIPGLNLGDVRGRKALAAIEMEATRRVGPNQQVMLLEVSGIKLLLGVSDGRMDVLHRWDDSAQSQPVTNSTRNSGQISGEREDNVVSNSPDISPTVRQRAGRTDQAPSAPILTPSAEELLDTWRDSVKDHPVKDEAPVEEVPWWMEGATSFERAVLSEDEVESIRVDTPNAHHSPERERVQESILATLRDRRTEEATSVQASERGMHDRAANTHGGFRAAARLGRQPRLGARTKPSPAVGDGHRSEASGSAPAEQRRTRSGSSMSFKL